MNLMYTENNLVVDLKNVLEEQFSLKPDEVVERYCFNMSNRSKNESISWYIAELWKLAKTCTSGNKMEMMIKDRIECGMQNMSIQENYLKEIFENTTDR